MQKHYSLEVVAAVGVVGVAEVLAIHISKRVWKERDSSGNTTTHILIYGLM